MAGRVWPVRGSSGQEPGACAPKAAAWGGLSSAEEIQWAESWLILDWIQLLLCLMAASLF